MPRLRRGVPVAFCVAPLCLAALVACGTGTSAERSGLEAGSVQIVGSETMRPVVAACAEEFMTRNPEADVIVNGGGSGDGIAALLHGIVDIGMTSYGWRELQILPHTLAVRDYAIALPAGSPIKEPINRALLKIVHRPEWKEAVRRYVGITDPAGTDQR